MFCPIYLPFRELCVFFVSVCSLSAGLSEGTVLSASWDATACVWKLDGSTNPALTLSGHQGAVWSAIQLPSGDIVTGSADKTIRVWDKDGQFQRGLSGMIFGVFNCEDCLCGLVVRVPGDRTEINCVSCEVRTELIYVM
jgi:WD40 repeat protein